MSVIFFKNKLCYIKNETIHTENERCSLLWAIPCVWQGEGFCVPQPRFSVPVPGMSCTPRTLASALLLEVLPQGLALLKAVLNSWQLCRKQRVAAEGLCRNASEKMCRKGWNRLQTGGTRVHFPTLPNSQTGQRAPTGQSLPSVAEAVMLNIWKQEKNKR